MDAKMVFLILAFSISIVGMVSSFWRLFSSQGLVKKQKTRQGLGLESKKSIVKVGIECE